MLDWNKIREELEIGIISDFKSRDEKLTKKHLKELVQQEVVNLYGKKEESIINKKTVRETTEKYKIKGYQIVNNIFDLRKLARKMDKLEEFAFDTETNTLRVLAHNKDFKMVGMSISWGEYDNYYIPTGHVFDEAIEPKLVKKYLGSVFAKRDIRIIGWNLKFDLHVIKRIGIDVYTLDLFDGMIASWICDENTPNGLKENTVSCLKVPQTHFNETTDAIPKEVRAAFGLGTKKATFDLTRVKDSAPYALDDAYYTWELYLYYLDKLVEEKMDKIYFRTYPQFLTTLFRMEERGMRVDIPKLKQMGVDMQKDLDRDMYKMYELAGVAFNAGSPQQVAELIYGYDKSKNPNKNILACSYNFPYNGEKPKTGADDLERLLQKNYSNKKKKEGQELIRALLEYKKLNKLKTSFVDGLIEQLYDDGRAHPSFNIIGTDSGRISCSKPRQNWALVA